MRWENLFDDLAGQLEHELGAEELDVRGEEERLRIGRLSLRDRLVALHEASANSPDYRVRAHLGDGTLLVIAPRSLGRDWIMGDLDDGRGRPSQCIVPFWAIGSLTLGDDVVERSVAATPPLRLSDRLGVTFVLRDLARRRHAVELHADVGVVHGTIDRVGRDHLDVAEHEVGSPRRHSEVSHIRLIPLTRLNWVRL